MTAFLVLLLASAAAPLADDPMFQEGQRLYHELEFEEAVIRFQEASLVEGRTDEEQATLFVWTGLGYAQLGRFDRAEGAFERAVKTWPDVALPSGVSPKIEKVFDRTARRVRAELASNPPAAPPAVAAGGAGPPVAAATSAAETPPREAGPPSTPASAAASPPDGPASSSSGPSGSEPAAGAPSSAPTSGASPAGPAAASAAPPAAGTDDAGPSQKTGPVSSSSSVEEPPRASGFGLSTAYWAGAATGGVIGGALVAGGLGLGVASFLAFVGANAAGNTQVAARAGETVANGLWIAAWPVGAAGVLALAAGATSATLAVVAVE